MVKLLKREDVNTEFNLYHLWMERRQMRATIKEFNKKYKSAVQLGLTHIHFYWSEYDYGNSILSRKARSSGVGKAISFISQTYPITHKCERFYWEEVTFDIREEHS